MTAEEFAAQSAAHAAILAAAAVYEQTKAANAEAMFVLRASIKAGFAAGVAPKNIVKASGLSRTTIYEIREGKGAVNEPVEPSADWWELVEGIDRSVAPRFATLAEYVAARSSVSVPVDSLEPAPRFASLAEYDAYWHPERGQ